MGGKATRYTQNNLPNPSNKQTISALKEKKKQKKTEQKKKTPKELHLHLF